MPALIKAVERNLDGLFLWRRVDAESYTVPTIRISSPIDIPTNESMLRPFPRKGVQAAMRDISGNYEVYDGSPTPIGLSIFGVDSAGQITNAGLGTSNNNVHGHYDDATARILFSSQRPQAHLTILTDFFTGGVVFDNQGTPRLMWGLHHHFGKPPDVLHGSITQWVALFQSRIIK